MTNRITAPQKDYIVDLARKHRVSEETLCELRGVTALDASGKPMTLARAGWQHR